MIAAAVVGGIDGGSGIDGLNMSAEEATNAVYQSLYERDQAHPDARENPDHLAEKAARATQEKSRCPDPPCSDADPYIREWKNEFVKHRYFVTNFEVNVAAMLGLLTHYATYSNSGSGSINVRKFTISDTGLLKDELFALSEIHAKSPGVSHFALYNDSDHYDCVKNTTSLARALRNREDGSMPPSAITDQELFYYDNFVRSACERRATDTIIEVPTGAAGVGIALSAADIARLGPDKWLNDELVNSCAVLINNLSKDMRTGGTAALKFGIASSFFLTKYLNYGPNMSGGPLQGPQAAQVFRSFGKLSKKQLGSGSSTSGFDVLVVPVVDFHNPEKLGTPALGRGGKPIPGQFHDGNPYHWRGVVVDFNKKSASGFDSFNDKTKSEDSAGDVLGALKAEAGCSGSGMDYSDWSIGTIESPAQTDGSSCGVFFLTSALMLALGRPLGSYSAMDIPVKYRAFWSLALIQHGLFRA